MLGAYGQAELTGHNSTLMEVGPYTASGDANVLRYILKNLHFLLKNVDFLLKNTHFIINTGAVWDVAQPAGGCVLIYK